MKKFLVQDYTGDRAGFMVRRGGRLVTGITPTMESYWWRNTKGT